MGKVTLPDRPSACLGLALDLLVERSTDPRYQICMGTWHMPIIDDGRCMICLAGALISQWGPPTKVISPLLFEREIRNRLLATDFLRLGKIDTGLDCFYDLGRMSPRHLALQDLWEERTALKKYGVPRWHRDQKAFLKAMRETVKFLEQEGH